MSKWNIRIVLLICSFVFTVAPAPAQGPGGPPSGAGNDSLANKVAALEARVAKLEGQITSSDLVGTYAFHGFQTELRAKVQDGATAVSSYVFQGTIVFNADGTASFSAGGTERGHALNLFQNPSIGSGTLPAGRAVINKVDGGSAPFTWTFANGVVTTSVGFPANVTAGGRVLVATGTNPLDGTTVLLIMTRLQ